MRRLLTILAAGAALAAMLAPTATAAPPDKVASASDVICRQQTLPVALAAGSAAEESIWGELCLPRRGPSPKTVHVLVHGATYDHNYWDFPYQSWNYSYVRHAMRAGFATFTIDRVGSGNSSHPASSSLDLYRAGHTVHQVVQALRRGTVGGRAFDKVIAVGHSMGSGAVWAEAGTYRDVDGVIVTGLTHAYNSQGRAAAIATTTQANLYPRWANLDDGYFTTSPGTRGNVFYNTALADPRVIETDERLKQTLTIGELLSLEQLMADGTSARIKAPVLLVVGSVDALFCGGDGADCSTSARLRAAEAAYYPTAKSFTAFAVPKAGHDINLQYNAGVWYGVAMAWAWAHIGR